MMRRWALAPALPTPIDLDALKVKAQTSAKALVSSLVDMARAEARDMMGEHQRALASPSVTVTL